MNQVRPQDSDQRRHEQKTHARAVRVWGRELRGATLPQNSRVVIQRSRDGCFRALEYLLLWRTSISTIVDVDVVSGDLRPANYLGPADGAQSV
jgi:hypothetical protein